VPIELAKDNGGLWMVYTNPEGFAPGSTVRVELQGCDLAHPANCSLRSDYSFRVSATGPAPAQGLIVPDGYWADDPTRPLQVKDLPLGWTVRIFNSAGILVRTFRNDVADGLDWSWDFTNDRGRKVARAVYLVRVSDEKGSLRRRGKFLVQKVP